MRRLCRTCGVEYEGDPGSTLCPACVKAQKSTTIRDRICRTCGTTFPGGPRAWYCPGCRRERKRTQKSEYNARVRAGSNRQLGSEDICSICGKPYTVTSGRQRYCPACAPEAVAAADRQQALAYYAEHGDPDKRRELRKAHAAELICAVCGKPYIPTTPAKTCSPACAKEHCRQAAAQWEQRNRERRNQYHRERYKIKNNKED